MSRLAANSVHPVDLRRLNNGDWIAEVEPTVYGIGRSREQALADLCREIGANLDNQTPVNYDSFCNQKQTT